MSDHAANREARAYLALQGASGPAGDVGDWRDDLAALFRSNDPLSPEIREALAKAFEGNLHGFRLELISTSGEKKRRQDAYRGLLIRRRWHEIGEWIENQIEDGTPVHEAIEAASRLPGTGDYKTCERARTYARRVRSWRAAVQQASSIYEFLGPSVDDLFHRNDAAGLPLDRRPPPT